MQLIITLVVFLLAMDDQIGTGVLRAPLVACTLVGALLGDITTGMTIGATCQVFYSLFNSEYIGSSLFSVITVIVAIVSGDGDAVNSVGFQLMVLIFGLEGCLKLFNTFFINQARKQAEKGSISTMVVILPLCIRGFVFAALAYAAYGNAATVTTELTNFYTNFSFLAKGFWLASNLMLCLGLAVVLRNLSVKDHYGALLAGFAVGAFVVQSNPLALCLCGLMAFGIGMYSLKSQPEVKQEAVKTNKQKGSAEKWW